jgi:acetyl esterase/lipase
MDDLIPAGPGISRRLALLGGLTLAGAAWPAAATTATPVTTGDALPLWPNGAPGAAGVTVTEEIIERSPPDGRRDRIVRGVRQSMLTPFLPARGKPLGAVLVIPGGGYKHVVIDKEGFEVAQWLGTQGFAAYVLRYRLPGDGWAAGPDAPLQDAQRALRVMRGHAAKFGVASHRAAVLGFSAGGHLAARLATRFDEATYEPGDAQDALSSRPDAAALLYPVITLTGAGAHAGSRSFLLGASPAAAALERWSAQNGVTPATPPCFIAHAADDTAVPLRNSQLLFDALQAADVPTDYHVFARGGHGFGLRGRTGLPASDWPRLFVEWIAVQKGFAGEAPG